MTRRLPLLLLCALTLAACAAFDEPSDRGASERSQVVPVEVFGGMTWQAVAAGLFHTCALDASGAAWCWGANQFAQLGVITAATCPDVGTCARRPLAVSGDHRFTRIAAGSYHTCALKENGEAWCWGGGAELGNTGLLGDGTLSKRLTPVRVEADSAFVDIAVGTGNTCALTASGEAWCWGKNSRGEVGDSTALSRGVPVRVKTDARFTRIAMGVGHSCGLRENGVALCWGSNRFGQLGVAEVPYDDVNARALAPVRVASTGSYTDLSLGANHACALRPDGGIECWGLNADAGQLGDSLRLTHRGVPGPIASNATFTTFDVGHVTACARTSSGATLCWGGNIYGAIGNGTRSVLPEQFPVAANAAGAGFTRYSGGGNHMCALDASQRLYCWGDRAYGQVGN